MAEAALLEQYVRIGPAAGRHYLDHLLNSIDQGTDLSTEHIYPIFFRWCSRFGESTITAALRPPNPLLPSILRLCWPLSGLEQSV